MERASLSFEQTGFVRTITIDRPEHLNALNADVLQSLFVEFARIEEDPSVRAVVLAGTGEKAFVAGADIRTMYDLGPRAIADYVELGQRCMRSIERSRVAVIAAVQGYALGGGLELALACDVIVASAQAKFGQPEVNLGLIPGFGGTQRLLQRCGVGVAKRLCITGDLVSGEEAVAIGLADKLVEPGKLLSEAQAMAERISTKAPLAVAAAKRVIVAAADLVQTNGLRREVDEFLRLFASGDREEGMQAFLDKRKPLFRGV
jgi:enoyl-CoA hydratase